VNRAVVFALLAVVIIALVLNRQRYTRRENQYRMNRARRIWLRSLKETDAEACNREPES